MFGLTDRVAIVTGGGRGIGRAIALGFAEAGAAVVVCDRSIAENEDTAARIRDKGRKALAIPADTRNADQMANLLDKVLASFGRIDILVNNAGGGVPGSAMATLQYTVEQWAAAVEQNLHSVFICSKIMGQQMVKQKTGNIINISSMAGLGPFPTASAYGAAKAGVISLTRSLSIEWAPYNIRINAIAPGFIETSLTAAGLERDPKNRQRLIDKIPLGRLGKPDDIVGTAIYFASDASSYVTGQTIMVSAGLTADRMVM